MANSQKEIAGELGTLPNTRKRLEFLLAAAMGIGRGFDPPECVERIGVMLDAGIAKLEETLGSDECDECDGSSNYYLNGEPQACIWRGPQTDCGSCPNVGTEACAGCPGVHIEEPAGGVATQIAQHDAAVKRAEEAERMAESRARDLGAICRFFGHVRRGDAVACAKWAAEELETLRKRAANAEERVSFLEAQLDKLRGP